jgi:hypothetical protein
MGRDVTKSKKKPDSSLKYLQNDRAKFNGIWMGWETRVSHLPHSLVLNLGGIRDKSSILVVVTQAEADTDLNVEDEVTGEANAKEAPIVPLKYCREGRNFFTYQNRFCINDSTVSESNFKIWE